MLARMPLVFLLDPRRERRLLLLMLIAGLVLATALVRLAGQPLWVGTVAALALLTVPVFRKTCLLQMAAYAYMRRMWIAHHPSLPGGQ